MYHRKSFSESRRESGQTCDSITSTQTQVPPPMTLTLQRSEGYTRRQWITFSIMAFTNLFSSVKVSLQGPFYPEEAEKKGATATEYGFVFGIFELTTFIMSPIYGLIIDRVGPTRMFKMGVYVAGISSFLFGFLDRIDDKDAFIWLSFFVRILESLGATAANTSSFTIIALEFPDSVASIFASLETFFGVGLILGGLLFELGGFTLPFAVMGLMLITCGVISTCFLPKSEYEDLDDYYDGIEVFCSEDQQKLIDQSGQKFEKREGFRIFKLLRIPGVCLACFGTMATSMSIGFISGILEPHIRPFNLTPFLTGAFFLIYGLVYAVTAPFWGKLCDKVDDPKFITVFGSIFIITSFSFLGPLPFLPCEPSITLSAIGLVFEGLGIGASIPSSFVSGLREARLNGFDESVATYGLISGLWVSMFSLGAFIGPSAGGILFDHFGFRYGSLLVIITQLILAISLMSSILYKRIRKNADDVEDLRKILEKHIVGPITSHVNVGTYGTSTGTTTGTSNLERGSISSTRASFCRRPSLY